MSKKIAQLTKVIYHLNNKNEDHDHDLADVSEQYETEIEQILKVGLYKCCVLLHTFSVQVASS
jgi:hypothetical protein